MHKNFIDSYSNEVHNDKYNYDKVIYNGNRNELVDICCYKHGFFKQSFKNHVNGFGCKKCATELTIDKISLSLEEFIDRANVIHKYKYDYSNVKLNSLSEKVKILCKEHGVFEQIANNHICGNGCPLCKIISKGEKKIKELLNDRNVDFVYQKKFNNCKNINLLPFDFYLLNYNLCIEYDGKQHFEPVCFNGCSVEDSVLIYKKIKHNDQIKNEYCKNNNIQLIRIPYWEFKNIEKILSKELNVNIVKN